MKEKDGTFRFKKFSVSHSRSSMKVGVDGVLVGAWTAAEGDRLLDVGTGCGVIALMLAQRNRDARITAIDVDAPSVEEASSNFRNSPWGDRFEALALPFAAMASRGERFDLIVSNPPYFDSGVSVLDDARKLARHSGELSPETLIDGAPGLLTPGGKLSMVVPSEYFGRLRERGISAGMALTRADFVRDHPKAKVKRMLLEFTLPTEGEVRHSLREEEAALLTLFDPPGEPTPQYRELGHDFYLKF